MLKHLFFLPIALLLTMACTQQEDIRGTFENERSEKITIDCNYRIHSTHLSGKPFLPKNGDQIRLHAAKIQPTEYTLAFMCDNMVTSFAVWNRNTDELTIGEDVYTRKSDIKCK